MHRTDLHLYNDNIDPIVAVERVSPAASPFITVQSFPFRRRRHASNVVKHNAAGYDRPSCSLAQTPRSAKDTILDYLVWRSPGDGWREDAVELRVCAKEHG